MNIKELTDTINDLYYDNSTGYKVIQSRQSNLINYFGKSFNITKISYPKIEGYYKHLKEKGYKPATIAANLSYLNSVLKYAYQRGFITIKYQMPSVKIKAHKDKIITSKELNQMLEYTITNNLTELYQLIIIGINTGIRVSNIISILPEDIDNNYIRLYHNKTNSPYSVPLNNTLKEVFKTYQPFTLNYRQLEYQFKKMIHELKLSKDITIHTLRHSFASKLVEQDIEPFVIMKLMNHKSINSTQRYTHIKNKTLEKAVNSIVY